MKLAFWTVTRGAGNIAKEYFQKLENFEIDVYTLKKFNIEKSIQIENFTEELEKNFNLYDGHIFIMASGIVIRKISNLLKSKNMDPAVLLIDEGKHFVISLLSGHLGGANILTNLIATRLNLIPVITTSSDITGKIAVDTIAQKLNSELEDLKSAKEVTSLIVDGKKVDLLLPKNIVFEKNSDNSEGFIICSNRKNISYTRIYPKNLILGIGCKKDTKSETILEAIENCFEKNNLSLKSIKHIATVDVKENEKGLIDVSQKLKLDLKIIPREEIKKVEHLFKGSNFVKESIGVSAVSEPVALISSSQKGEFLVMKDKYNGVTISIFEETY